jgi:hypothetical protein
MNNPTQLEILPKEEPTAIEAIERASVDIQIATAHRFPRTLSKVKADMLSFATIDEDTAQSCFYTLPRGGKTIQGPSVRLAEIAIASYGNLRIGARPIATVTTGDNPHVIVQAVCHDLEKNVAISIEKRRRITKKKNKDAIDEDDINLAVNSCSAIALRDATFKVVPLALIKPVYEQAKLVAIGDVKSLGAKRTKVIERLTQMGAKLENVLAKVEAKKIEDIDLSKLEILIGLGTALKDGDITLEEAFPIPTINHDAADKSLFGAGEAKKPEAKAEPKAEKKAEAKPEAAASEQKPEQAAAPEAPAEQAPVNQTEASFHQKLEGLMLDHGISESKLILWAQLNKHITDSVKTVSALPEAKAKLFASNFKKIVEQIKKPDEI